MALVLADRVLETTPVAGTGDANLSGAVTGYQPFSTIGNGNTTYYTIVAIDGNGTPTGDWEVGIGTYVTTGNKLTRDTVLSSSNGGAKVYFASGTKQIFLDLPSEEVTNGNVVGPASAVADNFASFNMTTGKLIKDSGYNASSFATAAQGAKADTAVQPGSLGTAAYLTAGAANGVATLDSSAKVPVSQLPAAVLGALSYQGTWNASTNTPTLVSSAGTKGYYYVVSVAGTTNLNGITDWNVGDWAVYDGSVWEKVDNTDSVTSVNGKTGTVVLTYSDVGAFPATSTTGSGNVVLQTGATLNNPTIGNYEAWTSASAPSYVEGLQWYDSTAHSLAYYNDSANCIVHIGQDIQVKVINNTGSTIPNGSPVYITSTSSGQTYPNIALAKADVAATSAVIGLTNGAITNGSIGYVTSTGGIDNVNTGTFTVGQVLYLSPYSAGQLMNTIPPTGITVQVGVVSYVNSSTGKIYVKQTTPLAVPASIITGTLGVANGGTGTTTLTGLVKGNGTSAFTAAVSGTDYAPATSGTSILYGNGSGGFSPVTIGSGVSFSAGTLSATGSGGTVTSVSGTAPIASTGGATPTISISQATTSTNGYLSSADWNTFNNKQPAGSYLTTVTASTPLSGSGTAGSPLVIAQATTSTSGYLSSTDWNTFNNKQATLVSGTNIKTVNSTSLLGSGDVSVGVLTVTGTAPVVSSGGANPAISMAAATTSVSGYLTSTDWNTFNGKYSTGGALGTPSSGTLTNCTGLPVGGISATGTPSSTTYLRGDGTWSTPASVGVNSVTGTAPISVSTTLGVATVSISQATTSTNGYLSSTDWNTFNGKGSGTVTSVGGTGTVNGLTLTGTVTTSGSLMLGGTLDLSSPPAIGGTTPAAITGSNLMSSGGLWAKTTYTGTTYTDGIIVDYTTGTGRFSVGTADGFAWYNAGLATTSLMTLSSAGALAAIASITAYSDERLKTNWREVEGDFVAKLANVKSGVYDRTDIEATQVGVSAQSLQELMPQAVEAQDDGYLAVNYGAAALVSAIELAKTVTELKETIKAMQEEINALKGK